MAFNPCSACGLFFKGAAQAAYPALVFGAESERKHLRLCPPCFGDYLEKCQESLSEAVVGNPPGLTIGHCVDCSDAPGRTALFVTVYPSKEEPRQFYGLVADGCVGAARLAWLG